MGEVKEMSVVSRKVYRDQLVTIADLKAFKAELLLALSHLIVGNSEKKPKKWLKSQDVKDLLNISDGTLQTLRSNGTIPFTKIGHSIFYDREAVNQAISQKQRQFGKGVLPPKLKYPQAK